MKKIFGLLIVLSMFLASCTNVSTGHKGVKIKWGGKADMSQVYDEGMYTGLSWMWNEMEEYDCREKTVVQTFEFNDKNNMVTKVEISLDFKATANKVHFLHTQITDVETKLLKTMKSAGKEVVPQYSAVELNISKRVEAETALEKILKEELPEFYLECIRVQMTDVDIPHTVSQLAEETAVQLGKNELALKKEAEQTALAAANVAKSKGEYEAAQFDVKTKALMSRPAVLELYKAETERLWAEKGVSKYGNNNVFGGNSTAVLKGLK